MKVVALGAFAVAVVLAETAVHPVSKPTGIYTDMVYNEESGDVLGMEVFIVYSGKGYFAVFQSSEGVPEPPIVVPVNVKDSVVEFVLPEGSPYSGKYCGKVTPEGLVGGFQDGKLGPRDKKVFVLPRRRSYWE